MAPGYIKAVAKPKVLKPGEEGVVEIAYNAHLKNKYGFQSDNIQVYTDDASEPVKSVSVFATVEEFFPELSPQEIEKAPKLFTDTNFDFGKITQQPVTKDVTIVNSGKKELLIRAVQPNCTCIVAALGKEKLKPGESTNLSVRFSPESRKGTQQKAVTIYSNDPVNPVQRITFSAYVGD
jgi:hypothetical protein